MVLDVIHYETTEGLQASLILQKNCFWFVLSLWWSGGLLTLVWLTNTCLVKLIVQNIFAAEHHSSECMFSTSEPQKKAKILLGDMNKALKSISPSTYSCRTPCRITLVFMNKRKSLSISTLDFNHVVCLISC